MSSFFLHSILTVSTNYSMDFLLPLIDSLIEIISLLNFRSSSSNAQSS